MRKEPSRFGRDAPVSRVLDLAPLINALAQLRDDRARIVLLFVRGNTGAFVESQLGLLGAALSFARLWDGCDESNFATILDDPLGRLAVLVQLPVAGGVRVRRVENWVSEELVSHVTSA